MTNLFITVFFFFLTQLFYFSLYDNIINWPTDYIRRVGLFQHRVEIFLDYHRHCFSKSNISCGNYDLENYFDDRIDINKKLF